MLIYVYNLKYNFCDLVTNTHPHTVFSFIDFTLSFFFKRIIFFEGVKRGRK